MADSNNKKTQQHGTSEPRQPPPPDVPAQNTRQRSGSATGERQVAAQAAATRTKTEAPKPDVRRRTDEPRAATTTARGTENPDTIRNANVINPERGDDNSQVETTKQRAVTSQQSAEQATRDVKPERFADDYHYRQEFRTSPLRGQINYEQFLERFVTDSRVTALFQRRNVEDQNYQQPNTATHSPNIQYYVPAPPLPPGQPQTVPNVVLAQTPTRPPPVQNLALPAPLRTPGRQPELDVRTPHVPMADPLSTSTPRDGMNSYLRRNQQRGNVPNVGDVNAVTNNRANVDNQFDVVFEETPKPAPRGAAFGQRNVSVVNDVAPVDESINDRHTGSAGRMRVTVPTFNGQNFHVFRPMFDSIVAATGWNEEQRNLQLQSAMRGEARTTMMLLRPDRWTYDNIMTLMETHFVKTTSYADVQTEVFLMKRKPNQTLRQFAVAIKIACQKAMLPEAECERLARQAFVLGLSDYPELRGYIERKDKQKDNLQSALDIALNWEREHCVLTTSRVAAKLELDNDNSTVSREIDRLDKYHKNSGRESDRVKALEEQVKKLAEQLAAANVGDVKPGEKKKAEGQQADRRRYRDDDRQRRDRRQGGWNRYGDRDRRWRRDRREGSPRREYPRNRFPRIRECHVCDEQAANLCETHAATSQTAATPATEPCTSKPANQQQSREKSIKETRASQGRDSSEHHCTYEPTDDEYYDRTSDDTDRE